MLAVSLESLWNESHHVCNVIFCIGTLYFVFYNKWEHHSNKDLSMLCGQVRNCSQHVPIAFHRESKVINVHSAKFLCKCLWYTNNTYSNLPIVLWITTKYMSICLTIQYWNDNRRMRKKLLALSLYESGGVLFRNSHTRAVLPTLCVVQKLLCRRLTGKLTCKDHAFNILLVSINYLTATVFWSLLVCLLFLLTCGCLYSVCIFCLLPAATLHWVKIRVNVLGE